MASHPVEVRFLYGGDGRVEPCCAALWGAGYLHGSPAVPIERDSMFHLSDRELHLLGEATRNETLALVGWMVLSNLLGKVVDHELDHLDPLPPMRVCRWIGSLNKATGFRGDQFRRALNQNVVPNSKRNVRVRTS